MNNHGVPPEKEIQVSIGSHTEKDWARIFFFFLQSLLERDSMETPFQQEK